MPAPATAPATAPVPLRLADAADLTWRRSD